MPRQTQKRNTINAIRIMKTHKISWLNMPGYKPETWNPIIGCSKVSPGCDNCYAEKMAIRLSHMPDKQLASDYKTTMFPGVDNKPSEWNGHTIFRAEYLLHPKRCKTPRMVFVCSMSDLFHEQTDFEKIDAVFSVMADCDQHIYVLLTKRPHRVVEFYDWKKLQHNIDWTPKDNIWFGFTVEDQKRANERLPYFNFFQAAVKFVSIEPMLSPVDFSEAIGHTLKWHAGGLKNCISWVICGGETGNNARPVNPDWVRRLRDDCLYADVPFFFKQWGTWCPEGTIKDYNFLIPSKEKVMGIDVMTRKPVVRNHDQLDGKQHHEWPKINL